MSGAREAQPGPLGGFTVLELAGLGGAPFAGMLLADLGARVIRIDRPPAAEKREPADVLNRGKESICIDLKAAGAVELVLRLAQHSHGLIESYRPGVMERLGLGPAPCLAASPRLVYGRLSGWGQQGPLAHAAGHDIDFIALAGALAHIGTAQSGPLPPLSLVADYAGGGMLLALGMLSGWLETARSGCGQVVDAAMLDGSALLMASVFARHGSGRWAAGRGANFMDGAAHYYTTYRCADGKWIAVGAIEPRFYALLMKLCGIAEADIPGQAGPEGWAGGKDKLQGIFEQKTRAQWCSLLEGTDACVAPVLEVGEAPEHPHNVARGVFTRVDGIVQPAPAPRFSRTPAAPTRPPPARGANARALLGDFGFSAVEIEGAVGRGAVVLAR